MMKVDIAKNNLKLNQYDTVRHVDFILALRLELVIAYQVAEDYSFYASVTV